MKNWASKRWKCFAVYHTINWSFGLPYIEQDRYGSGIRIGFNLFYYVCAIEIPYGKPTEQQE